LKQVEFGYQASDWCGVSVFDGAGALNQKFKELQRGAPTRFTADAATTDWHQQDQPNGQKRYTKATEEVQDKGIPVAFDDKELSAWVMRLGEERSGRFLCALAEAVMKADAEEYSVIRPALLDLKHRHRRRGARAKKVASPIARKKESNLDSHPQSGGL
jgi:hypothetical protein